MRVLYVTHYSEMYGANLSLLNMIICLREKFGIEPFVLLNSTGSLQAELEKNDIQYILCVYPKVTVNVTRCFVKLKIILKKALRLITYPKVYKIIKNIDERKRIDIIHSNSSVTDIGFWLSDKLKRPHVWHIREYGVSDYNLVPIDSAKKIGLKYQKSYVIAISKSIKEMLMDIFPNIHVDVIYNGVDIKEEYNKAYFCDGKVNFCIVGLISKNKNQIEAIKAAKELIDDNITNFCLYIIGGGFEDEDKKLMSYVKTNKLKKYVKFTGYINSISRYLVYMDVGIVPSKKEAFGRVTIESMSHYMPVIGSKSGGTAELIIPSYNGYLYESGNVNKLAEYMKSFVNERDKVIELGRNARRYSEKFTVEKNAQNIYRIYESIKELPV